MGSIRLLAALAVLLPSAAAAQEGVPLTADSRVVTRTIAEGDSAAGWTATARVPAIEGPAAADPQWEGFEALVDSFVAAEIEEFLVNFAEWESPDPEWTSSFDAEGSVLWAHPPILSIVLDVTVFYAGAAHPGHYAITLVWDADRGRALTTDDLFEAGSAWAEVLSEAAIPALESDLGEMADADWIAEGAGPDPANFTHWALVDGGLIVFFDPYQVAPYAAGPQAVTIPRAVLADVADPAGPLTPR
ncbi:MAG: RsiV family protein [Gemmatimonadota bacterium]